MRHFSPPVTDRKIRFALVGCGRISKNHFDSIRQHAAHAAHHGHECQEHQPGGDPPRRPS